MGVLRICSDCGREGWDNAVNADRICAACAGCRCDQCGSALRTFNARCCQVCTARRASATRTHDPAELLDELCAYVAQHDEPPQSDHWPRRDAVIRHFGSWNNALKTAGLPVRQPGENRGKTLWTRERLCLFLRRWSERHAGETPSAIDPGMPGSRTYMRLFGSWNNMVSAAGLDARPAGVVRNPSRRAQLRSAADQRRRQMVTGGA